MKLDTVIRGYETESTSSAQNNILCDGLSEDNVSYEATIKAIEKLKVQDYSVYILALICYHEGLRVSEVLSIRFSTIQRNGKCLIKRLKGSNSTIIDLSFIMQIVEAKNYKTIEPFNYIDRFYVYRCFKKVGLGKFYNNNKKQSVTHCLRHEYISQMAQTGISTEIIANNVGHKNTKNTEIYIHK